MLGVALGTLCAPARAISNKTRSVPAFLPESTPQGMAGYLYTPKCVTRLARYGQLCAHHLSREVYFGRGPHRLLCPVCACAVPGTRHEASCCPRAGQSGDHL